jgi:hypothetical protein
MNLSLDLALIAERVCMVRSMNGIECSLRFCRVRRRGVYFPPITTPSHPSKINGPIQSAFLPFINPDRFCPPQLWSHDIPILEWPKLVLTRILLAARSRSTSSSKRGTTVSRAELKSWLEARDDLEPSLFPFKTSPG